MTLVRAAERLAATADTLSASFARLLGTVLKDTERRLGGLLRQVNAGSRTAVVQTAQLTVSRQQLRTLLRAAGYDALVETATGAKFDAIADQVLRGRLARDSAALIGDDLGTKIRALQLVAELDLLDEGDALARALHLALSRGVFVSRTHAQILTDLADIIDRGEAQIRTLYDTTVSIFTRQVEVLQSNPAPSTLFAYLGPVDAIVRPFCLTHLGKVYTKAEIDALDNKQIPNVLLTGGGYNCRHVWTEISLFSELAALHGTRRRVPEVQEALDDMKRRNAA